MDKHSGYSSSFSIRSEEWKDLLEILNVILSSYVVFLLLLPSPQNTHPNHSGNP